MDRARAVYDELVSSDQDGMIQLEYFHIVGVTLASLDDGQGWTLLHHYATQGFVEGATYLLETCKVDVNAKAQDGVTALWLVCSQMEIQTCDEGFPNASKLPQWPLARLLLDQSDIDVNCPAHGKYPMHFAIESQDYTVMEAFSRSNLDLNPDPDRYEPYLWTLFRGKIPWVGSPQLITLISENRQVLIHWMIENGAPWSLEHGKWSDLALVAAKAGNVARFIIVVNFLFEELQDPYPHISKPIPGSLEQHNLLTLSLSWKGVNLFHIQALSKQKWDPDQSIADGTLPVELAWSNTAIAICRRRNIVSFLLQSMNTIPSRCFTRFIVHTAFAKTIVLRDDVLEIAEHSLLQTGHPKLGLGADNFMLRTQFALPNRKITEIFMLLSHVAGCPHRIMAVISRLEELGWQAQPDKSVYASPLLAVFFSTNNIERILEKQMLVKSLFKKGYRLSQAEMQTCMMAPLWPLIPFAIDEGIIDPTCLHIHNKFGNEFEVASRYRLPDNFQPVWKFVTIRFMLACLIMRQFQPGQAKFMTKIIAGLTETEMESLSDDPPQWDEIISVIMKEERPAPLVHLALIQARGLPWPHWKPPPHKYYEIDWKSVEAARLAALETILCSEEDERFTLQIMMQVRE
eukprot:maker-scaffold52_size450388-snap-gene-2.17 protein:Tk02873 transcript:maker-scaffold52_size450388-snap-gene-2.17-mRNA-1 annotation:"hypothetical protein AaeL_AAEL002366"